LILNDVFDFTREIVLLSNMLRRMSILMVVITLSTASEYSEREISAAWYVVSHLTLEQKIAQILVIAPYGYKFVEKNPVSGIIFNQYHIKSASGIRNMTEKFNEVSEIPLFFMVDQEGGLVNRLVHIPRMKFMPSHAEMGVWSSDSIYNYCRSVGNVMKELGLNVNLAPCLDVADDRKSVIGYLKRSFSGDPCRVVMAGKAFARGFRDAGVAAIAKHFPGYGESRTNSDATLARYSPPTYSLLSGAFVFAASVRDLNGVMMSSLIYPDLDSLPAVLSPKIVGLAHMVDPYFLVMTDDIWAPALRQWSRKNYKVHFTDQDFKKIVRQAFVAGNDLLLLMNSPKLPSAKQAVKELIEENPYMEERLDSSVVRVLLLKNRLYPCLLEQILPEGLPDSLMLDEDNQTP